MKFQFRGGAFWKAFSLGLSFCLVFTSAYLPEARASFVPIGLQRFAPPHSLGYLTDYYDASQVVSSLENSLLGTRNQKLVILIRDLHINYDAQRHIAGILDFYDRKELLPPVVAVEGAEGPIDASVLANYPDPYVRREAADYFVRKGELTGPGAYAVEKGLPHLLYGVEKRSYYEVHRKLFQKSLGARKKLWRELSSLDEPLRILKSRELAGTPRYHKLIEAEREVTLLRLLLNQQVNEDEVRQIATHLPRCLNIAQELLETPPNQKNAMEQVIRAAIDYYVMAMVRERPMFENTLALLSSSHTQRAMSSELKKKSPGRSFIAHDSLLSTVVLVAGGFHTAGLTALLRSRGISYAVVTPRVDHIKSEDQQLYEERLMGRHVTVQEILSDHHRYAAQGAANTLGTDPWIFSPEAKKERNTKLTIAHQERLHVGAHPAPVGMIHGFWDSWYQSAMDRERKDPKQWWRPYRVVAIAGFFEETILRPVLERLIFQSAYEHSLLHHVFQDSAPWLSVVLYSLLFAFVFHRKAYVGKDPVPKDMTAAQRSILLGLSLGLGAASHFLPFGPIANYLLIGLVHAGYNLFARKMGQVLAMTNLPENRFQQPDRIEWRVYPKDKEKNPPEMVFEQEIPKERFAKFSGVVIKGHLDQDGKLITGGREWTPQALSEFAHAPVSFDVENGLVTELRMLSLNGQILKRITFNRFENVNGLQDVFLGDLTQEQLTKKKGIKGNQWVKGIRLDEKGQLKIIDNGQVVVLQEYPDYPFAEIELRVREGEVVLATIVKDQSGQPIDSRTGKGYGRTDRDLFKDEALFHKELFNALVEKKYTEEVAAGIASALMRMKNDSFLLLYRQAFFSVEELMAIRHANVGYLTQRRWDNEKRKKLSGADLMVDKIERLISMYRRIRITNPLMITRLLTTHLLTPAYIMHLRRTYELHEDNALINDALEHPHVEEFIRSVLLPKHPRGTFDAEHYLHRYGPHKENQPLVLDERKYLIDRFKRQLMILQHLINHSLQPYKDDAYRHHIPYRNKIYSSKRISVTVDGEPEKLENLRYGDILVWKHEAQKVEFEIRGIVTENSQITLSLKNVVDDSDPSGPTINHNEDIKDIAEKMRANGEFWVADKMLITQRDELLQIIKRLESSHLTTTGYESLDRVLGLRKLTVPKGPESPITFINPNIPYQPPKGSQPSKGDQSQMEAVRLALNPTEVLFIEGPAATGKTTTIEEIIRQAVRSGKRVLLVSQMNQAVDKALENLINTPDPQVPVLRLGDSQQFRYQSKKVWEGYEGYFNQFKEQLKKTKNKGFLIAGTGEAIIRNKRLQLSDTPFDILIMDESSREMGVTALPLFRFLKHSAKTIFVGDNQQLPPFGWTDEQEDYLRTMGVQEADIELSMEGVFDWLLNVNHAQEEGRKNFFGDRITLSTMHRTVSLLARLKSWLFYRKVTPKDEMQGDVHTRGYEDFDLDTLSFHEIKENEAPRVGNSYRNRASAKKVIDLVNYFKRERNIPFREITIITPYAAQRELIQRFLPEEARGAVTVTTIDSFQGGENETVIVDFVRSNHQRAMGFIKDLRRLLVAISRERRNLAIVWNRETFTDEPVGRQKELEDKNPAYANAREKFRDLLLFFDREVLAYHRIWPMAGGYAGLKVALGAWAKQPIQWLRRFHLPDRWIAGILGFVEQLWHSGVLTSALNLVGIYFFGLDAETALLASSVMALVGFANSHRKGRYHLMAGRLELKHTTLGDLIGISILGGLFQGVYLLTVLKGWPVLGALALASFFHGLYNAYGAGWMTRSISRAKAWRNWFVEWIANWQNRRKRAALLGTRVDRISFPESSAVTSYKIGDIAEWLTDPVVPAEELYPATQRLVHGAA